MKSPKKTTSFINRRTAGNVLKALVACATVALACAATAATAKVGSYTWTYVKVSGGVQIGNGVGVAVKPAPTGALSIPSKIGKYAVKAIAPNAFKDCGMTSVTVPGSVKSVGDYAFHGCTSLKNVTLSPGVASVGKNAFSACASISWIAMPSSLTTMGDGAFFGSWAPTGDREVYYELAGDDERLKTLLKESGSGSNAIDFYLRCKFTVKPNNTKYGTTVFTGTTKSSIWEFADNGDSITAKPKKGYVFVGWFMDKACKTPLTTKENGGIIFDAGASYRQKTLAVIMPDHHTTLYAKFITKAADKKALKFSAATKKLATTPAKFTAGMPAAIQISASSATAPRTYSAKGLPSGLTIDKATGEISGEAKKAGSFTATVTVKSGGGSTLSQKVRITVYAPSWVRGTYQGVALPGTKASDPPAHLKFTVGSTGKVSGSVTYKGKAYSFSANCAYCYGPYMRFVPSIKIGKTTFKPGTVTVTNQLAYDRPQPTATCDSERFRAYKSCNFIKAGELGESYDGTAFLLDGGYDVSGLAPGKVSLQAALLSGDRVILAGKVNGKKVSMSTQLHLRRAFVNNDTFDTAYEMVADIIFPDAKYYRTLKLTFIQHVSGSLAGRVILYEPEIDGIDVMWE